MNLNVKLLFAVLALACCHHSPTALAQLRAGAAKVDITPPPGVSLDGPISKNGPVTSTHDPLHARALVLDDAHTKIAIVVVDQCMTAREVFDAAKSKIAKSTNIPTDCMLMAATHTHAAPRTVHIVRKQIDDEYHQQLADSIAQAVIAADRNLAPAQIGHGSFDLIDTVACRRFVCQPGSVGANPFGELGEQIKSVAGSSSKVIEPAGPVDPQFSVLSVKHLDGRPLCVLGNFSVHYCGGYQRGAVSADYFGHFCQAIEATLGDPANDPPVVGIMSNGTSGNTGSFQILRTKKFKPFGAMEFFGRSFAEQAIAKVKTIEHRGDVTIEMRQRELELGVRKPDTARLSWAAAVLADPDAKHPHRWSKVYAQEAQHLAEYPETEKLILQTIRIGDIAIASAPCEVFAETGLAIKAASPFAKTFTMELANGYGGYLPPREQHELGGYESWPARSSFLAVDAEEKIRSTLIGMLRSLAADRPLWTGPPLAKDSAQIPFVQGAIHHTIHEASEGGFKFGHEHDGKLYVVYSIGKEDCGLSILPIDALAE
jgi:hypothetical protein